jgi:hypothetical protein
MEQRLQQRKSTHYSPDGGLNQRLAEAHAEHRTQTAAMHAANHQRSPVAGAFSQHQDTSDMPPPLPEKDQGRESTGKHGRNSRPGTARQSQQAVPGALPPTPTSSEPEGEYRTKHSQKLGVKLLLIQNRFLSSARTRARHFILRSRFPTISHSSAPLYPNIPQPYIISSSI